MSKQSDIVKVSQDAGTTGFVNTTGDTISGTLFVDGQVNDTDVLRVGYGLTELAVRVDSSDGELRLSAQDGSGNNYTKYMTFYTEGGSGPTEGMRIDGAGRVTMPYQPAFVAVSNVGSTAYTGGSPIVMNISAINIGNHYNSSTGYFTAPVAGMYAFKFTLYSYSNAQFQAMKNGVGYIESGSADVLLTTIGGAEINGLAWSMYLQAGDYVGFGPRSGYNVSVYRPHGQFSGYLIG